jgi:hypothetical protein
MRTIVLVLSLIALAPPSHAAQKTGANAQYDASECRNLVGSEVREGTGENSHVGQLQVQRFSECLQGRR